jgi:hypothetical protein
MWNNTYTAKGLNVSAAQRAYVSSRHSGQTATQAQLYLPTQNYFTTSAQATE